MEVQPLDMTAVSPWELTNIRVRKSHYIQPFLIRITGDGGYTSCYLSPVSGGQVYTIIVGNGGAAVRGTSQCKGTGRPTMSYAYVYTSVFSFLLATGATASGFGGGGMGYSKSSNSGGDVGG